MKNNPIILLLLLMAGALLVVGQLYVTLPLVEELAMRWQVTPGQASWVGSAFGFAYAAGLLLLGRLSDRHGRRRVLLIGLVATAVTSVVVAFSISFPMLLGARMLQGLLAATFSPAALALVAEAFSPARRSLGISLLSFAFLAAAPLAQFMAAQFSGLGLPAIMVAVAIAYVLLAVGLAWILPQTIATPVYGNTAMPSKEAVHSWLQPELMGVWLAATTVLFAFVIFHAGAQDMGLSITDMQALRLAGLPPLLLSIAAAGLIRRIGTVATARIGFVVAAVGLLVGLPGHFWLLLVASVLLSAGIALAVPGLIGTLAVRAMPTIRARAMSLYTFALFMGASVASPIAHALASHGWLALLLVPTAALACAAVIVNGLPTALSRRSVIENSAP